VILKIGSYLHFHDIIKHINAASVQRYQIPLYSLDIISAFSAQHIVMVQI